MNQIQIEVILIVLQAVTLSNNTDYYQGTRTPRIVCNTYVVYNCHGTFALFAKVLIKNEKIHSNLQRQQQQQQ